MTGPVLLNALLLILNRNASRAAQKCSFKIVLRAHTATRASEPLPEDTERVCYHAIITVIALLVLLF